MRILYDASQEPVVMATVPNVIHLLSDGGGSLLVLPQRVELYTRTHTHTHYQIYTQAHTWRSLSNTHTHTNTHAHTHTTLQLQAIIVREKKEQLTSPMEKNGPFLQLVLFSSGLPPFL